MKVMGKNSIAPLFHTLRIKIGAGIALLLLALLLSFLGFFFISKARQDQNYRASKVITDPRSGELVLVDELVILGSGDQDIQSIVKEFGGTITTAVEETATYQVKFNVSNLSELEIIEEKLNNNGVRAFKVIVIESFDEREY